MRLTGVRAVPGLALGAMGRSSRRWNHDQRRCCGSRRTTALGYVAVLAVALCACGTSPSAQRGSRHERTSTAASPTAPAPATSAPAGSSGVSPTASTSPTSSAGATWSEQTVPSGVGYLQSVTCPTAADCYAVGSKEYGSGPGWIVASSDGGDNWQLLDTTPAMGLAAVTCPNAQTCIAVGGSLAVSGTVPDALVTTDGGHVWSKVTVPAQVGGLSDIACMSTTRCITVGGGSAMALTTDGGRTWTTENLPSGFATVDSVTCPTSAFCLLGGSGPGPGATSPSMDSVTHNGGASWSAAAVVGGASTLGHVSCSNATDCVGIIASDATDTYGTGTPIVTTDGASTWQPVSTTVGGSVSCVQHFCVSAGATYQAARGFRAAAFVSTDGGLQWTPMSVSASQGLEAVTCHSSADCLAVGGNFPANTTAMILTYRS